MERGKWYEGLQPSSHTIHDNHLLVGHPASMKDSCLYLLAALDYRIWLFAPPQDGNDIRAYLINQYVPACK